MRYYQYDQTKNEYVRVNVTKLDETNINNKLIFPEKYKDEEVVETISSFQDVHIERRRNDNYEAQLKTYRENCIISIPDFEELKKLAINTLLNVQTDRTAELLVLKHKINQSSSIRELSIALQDSYANIMESARGEGSRLAEALRIFLRDNLFHHTAKVNEVGSDSSINVTDPTYDIKKDILNTIIANQPEPDAPVNLNLKMIGNITDSLMATNPSSAGLKEIKKVLESEDDKEQKLENLREIASSRLNAKSLFAGFEKPRSESLKDFYVYILAGDQNSLTILASKIAPRGGKSPASSKPDASA